MEQEELRNYFKNGGLAITYTDRGTMANRDPYRYANIIGWFPEQEELRVKKEMRRRHAIGWLQVIITFAVITLLIIGICSITVPAKGEGFPSYWELDTELVKTVQTRLNAYGANLTVDGKFGPETSHAVKAFQRWQGIKISGVVDDQTAEKLGIKNWPSGTTMYYMTDLSAIYAQSDYEDILYVSLGGRAQTSHFSIFRDGILVAETACITGDEKAGFYTRAGVYTVGEKTIVCTDEAGYNYYNQLAARNRRRSLLIHSELCLPGGTDPKPDQTFGAHETNGDIIVPLNLSAWLVANAPAGVTVVIDDRNYQPSSIGYESFIEDDTYADWD